MCGFFGSIAPFGRPHPLTDEGAGRMLGLLDHRGPDGRGLQRFENVVMGHTRLAVRDPRHPGAAQPIQTPCGRYVLVYNGEVYNDAELREWLEPDVLSETVGRGFQTGCDAETVLWALALHGAAALDRLQGMYALAFVDRRQQTLLFARDPLGVKPLVWSHFEGGGVVLASEPRALLEHPGVARQPDPDMLGAYLITSRRTLAGRTMFRGVHSVEPGAALMVDLYSEAPAPVLVRDGSEFTLAVEPWAAEADGQLAASGRACAEVVERVLLSQLISDVPVCALLSGGLDSAILTRIVARERRRLGAEPLSTWCASGYENGAELGLDPPAARDFAQVIGASHHDVHLDRETYLGEWRAHVHHLGQPLSTPNEVAIARTAQAIRASGSVVTLSGEGADELFGGYDATLAAFQAHAAMEDPPLDAARFHLEVCSWVSPAALHQVMRADAAVAAAEFCVAANQRAFERVSRAAGPAASPLDAHLRLQRVHNLTPLLERLDAATMRFGVEGRTPFADQRILAFADALPVAAKFVAAGDGRHASKRVLRRAFASSLPPSIVARPKASFPLPFERWSACLVEDAVRSPFVREWVQPEVLKQVQRAPETAWKLAWLVGNLALFGEAAFGASMEPSSLSRAQPQPAA